MANNIDLSMIYLGNFADIDPNESNSTTENEAALFGTFGSAANPLQGSIVTVDSDSPSRFIDANHDTGNGTLTYDLGAGTTTTGLDSFVTYFGVVTYTDGSTDSQALDILQMTNGDLFMPAFDGYTAYGTKGIQSITLNSVEFDGWGGFRQSSYDDVEFVCFARGTRIKTPAGDRAIEAIKVGDLVLTNDHGAQRVIWSACRALEFPASPDSQKPIEFKAGCFGSGVPRRTLTLSPQHRVLLHSSDRGRDCEGLAPSVCMTGLKGVRRKLGCRKVEYHTLLFHRHEIIFAEGVAVESFYPGPVGLSVLGPIDRLRLIAVKPELKENCASQYGPMARPAWPNQQARDFCKSGQTRVAHFDHQNATL
ncbi:MAG: Hint domain-containing protein [Octadecabacter sp.]|nr:Hint domain-containing protein [Octadecabacter sp.]